MRSVTSGRSDNILSLAGTRRTQTHGGYLVRRLGREDLPEIERHLLELNPIDRGQRFHAMLDDAAVGRYVRRFDLDHVILVGAVEPATRRLVGLAEAHLDPSTPHVAEVSVSVSAHRRGQGIGRRVVAAVLDEACARGAEQAAFFFLPGNRALVRLVRALGGRVDATRGHATVEALQAIAA